ncbi:hypothetical protein C9374_004462 [Naegleria lovaniensis]|uniref:MHD domain-containing protein n=1 Tax=Naegleria lovaniensis TaxID=51637 RepID=A0AA88GML3_NAELO|nr:uncharacterized protein C9374_004462 [Naegleria lovaniensis]KAG2383125.1 hypothetical protein C9374_004462 [Naegleria lovaniensis]
MIDALLILNARGQHLLSRSFKDRLDIRGIVTAFKTQILTSKLVDKCPVKTIAGLSFMFIRYEDLFVLTVSRQNSNAALVYEFMYKFLSLLACYLTREMSEEMIREHAPLIYELLDETLDFGYPQHLEIESLKSILSHVPGGNENTLIQRQSSQEISEVLKHMTGDTPWRRHGIVHSKNQVFLDVIENVNMLMNEKGSVLSCDVNGRIVMNSMLSGMPECRIGLNDNKLMNQRSNVQGSNSSTPTVTLSSNLVPKKNAVYVNDFSFHQCVQLKEFQAHKTISFVPPDGEFELMRYRVSQSEGIIPPFRLLPPIVNETSKNSKLEVKITVKSMFPSRLFGRNVQLKIPCPSNTAKCQISVPHGRASYKADQSCIVWIIKRFPGDTEMTLHAEIDLIAQTSEVKKWSRPPIHLNFQVPMFAASGMHIRFLKVLEKSNYETTKWVKYSTQTGVYECRI